MRQRERESLAPDTTGDSDPHAFLFGDDDGYDAHLPRPSRADRRHQDRVSHQRKSRRGRWFVLLAVVIVAVVAYLVVPRVVDYFSVADYSGAGTGTVSVTIHSGASAQDIGDALQQAGVVKSAEAFTDAASDNSKSESIQPGTYRLHTHMSGVAALNLLLDPSSRVTDDDVLVPEGATSMDVTSRLSKLYGPAKQAEIAKALHSAAALSVPVSYQVHGKFPSTVEGFLYPATYTFDPATSPTDALTKMVVRFVQQDRSTDFASAAKKVDLTPYQALIVASMVQSEAKFPQDMPKVARVILNRLQKHEALKIDSTTLYACEVNHVAQAKCIYHQYDSPYNTYLNMGLPPTPIDNPGAEAMAAAVQPAKGNWIYYVNGDKDGHLFFTADPAAFEQARLKCEKNNWGCA